MALRSIVAFNSHIIAIFEGQFEVLVHVVVIHSHEQSVHYNTQCDEEFHEWIEDYESDQFLDSDPTPAAVPHTQDIYTFEATRRYTIFEQGSLALVLI